MAIIIDRWVGCAYFNVSKDVNMRVLYNISTVFMVLALYFGTAVTAQAADTLWSVEQAQTKIEDGTALMLDIRTEQEWAETGIAKGAWPVSMHKADFGKNLQSIIQNNPNKTIAIICATGGRTAYIMKILAKNNINDFVDVSEGMMGSAKGAGWIKKGLPIVSMNVAQTAVPLNFKAQ
jgi:rhodanese-related sulfurtransferase